MINSQDSGPLIPEQKNQNLKRDHDTITYPIQNSSMFAWHYKQSLVLAYTLLLNFLSWKGCYALMT